MVIHRMMHVTPADNIDSIREQGLLAHFPGDGNWPNDAENPECATGVYLIKTGEKLFDYAEHCANWCSELSGEPLAAVAVNVVGLDLEIDPQLTWWDDYTRQDAHKFYTPDDIPLEHLLGCSTLDIDKRKEVPIT
ncbi:hypothetical protein [Sinimarinibacterium flocculans]|uniref:hypothetical protein n=1 Tax=Sinimarinibacterium flocculans TaxID=985250 RepID=UPI002491B29C|nr:hypothetical protein [Sinimarinibacterium flocculans]